jgi:hypothetical protein
MSDFFSLVQKLQNIEDNVDTTSSKPAEASAERKDIMETANILRELDAIEVTPKSVAEVKSDNLFEAKDEVDVEETMNDRFAKFLKAERASGSDIDAMKSMIDEGTAEYEYADRAFSKMGELIETMQSMVAEGGMLGRKINEAGGDATALDEMVQSLNAARDALTRAHSDALGIALEQVEED